MKYPQLIAFALIAALVFPFSVSADTLVNIPHPSAVWDSTTAQIHALGIPGQGTSGQTLFPSGAIVGTSDTQNLTNKTLTNPIIVGANYTGPAPNLCGATCVITSANSGQVTLLNSAAGSVATLPAATGTGNVYSFVVSVAVTSNKDAILAASSADSLYGLAIGEHSNTPLSFPGGPTLHSLQMPFAGTQPSGGFIGDNFSCKDVSPNFYQCTGSYQGGVTPTTPYSTSTT